MMRFLKIVLFLIFCVFNNTVFAHAVVTHNSLNDKPVPVNQASQIELSFNSKVELDLSEVFLVRAGDKMETLHAVKGKKQGEVILDIPALEVGEYAIKLKIFAADGHLSEDLLRFFVRNQAK